MTAAGRITRDETEYVFPKPLTFDETMQIAAFIRKAERRGDAAVRIENELQVKLYIVRN